MGCSPYCSMGRSPLFETEAGMRPMLCLPLHAAQFTRSKKGPELSSPRTKEKSPYGVRRHDGTTPLFLHASPHKRRSCTSDVSRKRLVLCCAENGLGRGATRERGSIALQCSVTEKQRSPRPFSAQPAVFLASRVVPRSLQTHPGYAHRSRLAGGQNPLLHNTSHLRDPSLADAPPHQAALQRFTSLTSV